MKVAITGANGFLGKYLVKSCLASGYEVTALVRKTVDVSVFPKNDKLVVSPINYNEIVDELGTIKSQKGVFDFFIHNAGKTTSINRSDYTNINTDLTDKLVNAISDTEFLSSSSKLVYISSYTAQGPVGVDHPVSCYGDSKKKAEEFILNSKFSTVIFRPTAIYGAGDKAFLPLFQAANKGIYPLTRLDQKMTMIHAADLASIVAQGMENKEGIIHVSDGNTYSHAQFRDTLSVVLNRKIRNIRIPSTASKISLWLSDIWYNLSRGTPNLTLEKFEEISQDWDLHENKNLVHSDFKIAYDLKRGFQDAYDYYNKNNLL